MKLFLYQFGNRVEQAGLVTVLAVCFCLLLVIIAGCTLWFIRYSVVRGIRGRLGARSGRARDAGQECASPSALRGAVAIAASSVLCCLVMVPMTIAFRASVAKAVEGAEYGRVREEIRLARTEAENIRLEAERKRLEQQNTSQREELDRKAIREQELEEQITLLRNTQLSFQNFSRMMEVALLETELRSYDVRKVFDEGNDGARRGLGFVADYYDDYYFIIQSHDLNAKYGVDLHDVFVKEGNGGALYVYGIRPKYIGSTRNNYEDVFAEKIRDNYKQGVIASRDVLSNNALVRQKAAQVAKRVHDEFNDRLALGQELAFLDEPVTRLAENFIRVIFAPLCGDRVMFLATPQEGGTRITDFLEQKIASVEAELQAVSDSR